MRQRRRGHAETIPLIITFCLLGAIALPIVGRVGAHKRREICQNNLKQIARACSLYVQDNAGSLPRFDLPARGQVEENEQQLTHWAYALYSYHPQREHFACNADNSASGARRGTSYYLNAFVSGQKRSRVKPAEKVVLFTEGASHPDGRNAIAYGPQRQGNPIPYSRHLGGSNYVFVDGHVKWLHYNEIDIVDGSPLYFEVPERP